MSNAIPMPTIVDSGYPKSIVAFTTKAGLTSFMMASQRRNRAGNPLMMYAAHLRPPEIAASFACIFDSFSSFSKESPPKNSGQSRSVIFDRPVGLVQKRQLLLSLDQSGGSLSDEAPEHARQVCLIEITQ